MFKFSGIFYYHIRKSVKKTKGKFVFNRVLTYCFIICDLVGMVIANGLKIQNITNITTINNIHPP